MWLWEGSGQAQLPVGMGGPSGQMWLGRDWGVPACTWRQPSSSLDLLLIAGHTLGDSDTQLGNVIGAGMGWGTDIPRGDRILYSLGFEKTENGC